MPPMPRSATQGQPTQSLLGESDLIYPVTLTALGPSTVAPEVTGTL